MTKSEIRTGSISSSRNPAYLMPALARYALVYLPGTLTPEQDEAAGRHEYDPWWESEEAEEALSDLMHAMGRKLASLGYLLGVNPLDSADIGVWRE
jgi:hypothetical protein